MGTGYNNPSTKDRTISDLEGDTVKVNGVGAIFADKGDHARTAFDKRFFYEHDFASVAAGSTVTVTIYTNSKAPHGAMHIKGEDELSYTVRLSSTTDTSLINGTQDYQFNINRGKNNVNSVASFYFNDTSVSTSGYFFKTLETGRAAAGRFSTPNDAVTIDWLLDSYRIYNITIKNEGAGAAWVMFRYNYHEHDLTACDVAGDGEDEAEYDAGGHV